MDRNFERYNLPKYNEVELTTYEKKLKQRTSGPSDTKRQLNRKKRR